MVGNEQPSIFDNIYGLAKSIPLVNDFYYTDVYLNILNYFTTVSV